MHFRVSENIPVRLGIVNVGQPNVRFCSQHAQGYRDHPVQSSNEITKPKYKTSARQLNIC